MTTLFLVPTRRELALLHPEATSLEAMGPLAAYREPGAVWAVCGIGPAASAVSAHHLVAAIEPERAIMLGIAGAYAESGIKPGDLIKASGERFADLGYRESDGRYRDLDAMGLSMLTGHERKWGSHLPLADPGTDLPTAEFLTVSAITNSHVQARELWASFGAALENMEGAGAALACALLGTPFSEIRAVSNIVGPRDPAAWLIEEPLTRLGSLARTLI